MLRISDALDDAISQLEPVVGDNVRSECLLLLAFVTGRQASSLRLSLDDEISPTHLAAFNTVIAKRKQHQPISQIIGYRDFWKHRFVVTPDVLDPRPDTETLVEKAVELGPFETVLDLGTGSGCILLSLLDEWPQAIGQGVDASTPALDVAKRNASSLGLTQRSQFILGDWCNGISKRFDLVVSNPPYITKQAMEGLSPDVRNWEPRMALTPEGDGLDAYRSIATTVRRVMNPNAVLLLEIGFDQGNAVTKLLSDNGFLDVQLFTDINGKDRVVYALNGEK
jgi:release factor glutamine methyltransferase